jgi:hypothetical protein
MPLCRGTGSRCAALSGSKKAVHADAARDDHENRGSYLPRYKLILKVHERLDYYRIEQDGDKTA